MKKKIGRLILVVENGWNYQSIRDSFNTILSLNFGRGNWLTEKDALHIGISILNFDFYIGYDIHKGV